MSSGLADYRDLLPRGDADALHIELTDGAILVAGRYALIMIREGEVTDSAMWYEVQSARWEGEKQELSVNWVDPARSPLVVHSSHSPMRPFMEDISEKVNRTQVLVRSIKAPNGAVITAQIRKREDGELFSVLAARGRLDDEAMELAHSLEKQLRESVGLE